ncbi:MAG: methylenetetrahydrofolate reductase C-terminal domain-containing protein [Gammaproteobacteria bacterium]|nr:methylenetetrahydrofolate reductase C-terminal domain-containing protein [Gammaproteobacteria bacterium]
MYAVRRWSVRHARGMEIFYAFVEKIFVALHPFWKLVGYERADKPVAAIEKVVKGFLFDCQMCGQCALSSTGMSCPMNCPKNLRNGPCGGVRANGNCEVKPEMKCVWVEGFKGSERMEKGPANIRVVQFAVDRRLQGKSSFLRVVREKVGYVAEQDKPKAKAGAKA